MALEYAPPPGPPPVLNRQRHEQLSEHGYLFLPLADPLVKHFQRLSIIASAFFDQDEEAKRTSYPSGPGTEVGYYEVKHEKEYVTFRWEVHPQMDLEIKYGKYGKKLDVFCIAFCAKWPKLEVLLWNGDGLQVLHRTDDTEEWIDCKGPTILIADSLRVLLQGTVAVGYHRVISNPSGRSSVVVALRPCLKHLIDMAAFGGYASIDAKVFWKHIQATKFNVNAEKDIRDKQLALLQEQQARETAHAEASSNEQTH
ncbi:hypothetical protein MBLNU230_g7184t1 [Neophaeotheca triangularis]